MMRLPTFARHAHLEGGARHGGHLQRKECFPHLHFLAVHAGVQQLRLTTKVGCWAPHATASAAVNMELVPSGEGVKLLLQGTAQEARRAAVRSVPSPSKFGCGGHAARWLPSVTSFFTLLLEAVKGVHIAISQRLQHLPSPRRSPRVLGQGPGPPMWAVQRVHMRGQGAARPPPMGVHNVPCGAHAWWARCTNCIPPSASGCFMQRADSTANCGSRDATPPGWLLRPQVSSVVTLCMQMRERFVLGHEPQDRLQQGAGRDEAHEHGCSAQLALHHAHRAPLGFTGRLPHILVSKRV